MEAKVYNQKGDIIETIKLSTKVFGSKWRPDLVHQVVQSMLSNKRSGTADAKDRGEVRGGGRKPWKQKGTGRARHGSTRSPIWVGGGVTHGPLSEKNYKRKISKKMRVEALFSVLSQKIKDNEIIFIDSFILSKIKTKEAFSILEKLSNASGLKQIAKSKDSKTLVAFFDPNKNKERSFKNLPQIKTTFLKNINPVDILNFKYLLIENPKESIKFLESRAK